MSRMVLDASALLAVMFEEPGWELVMQHLEESVMSSVNIAEVQSRLVRGGVASELAWASVMKLVPEVVGFDREQARLVGDLIRVTQPFGLSFGDRACLALAKTLGTPALTADKAWKRLRSSVKVQFVR